MSDKRRPVLQPQKDGGSLKFLYDTAPGRLVLKALVNPLFSRAGGAFMSSRFSKRMIGRFIEKNGIDMNRYEEGPFSCYNDFFCRRLRRELSVSAGQGVLISPCDAKLSVFRIEEDSRFFIKGSSYSIADLLQNHELAEFYQGGWCLIFRLTVDDYHRYCYVDDGAKGPNVFIPGKLHTVQPIALKRHDIYKENCREYTVMDTDHFGQIVQIEVGALMVGKILNFHQSGSFHKGEEKGMFQFGGSTIVLLLRQGSVQLDQELLDNTADQLETIVKIGEGIGRSI